MIIKCKDERCDFRFVSTKDRIHDLIMEKEDHEALTKHKVVFLIAIRTKLIEKENPDMIYRIKCTTCEENKGTFVIYETILGLDANRFIDIHNANMAKKEKNMYQEHVFDIVSQPFDDFAKEMRDKSPVINKMRIDDISPEDINFKEKRIETGDQELAFFLREDDAKDKETRMVYNIYKNTCPICHLFLIRELEHKIKPKRRLHLESKKYDIALAHIRDYHSDHSMTINIVTQCVIFQRNKNTLYTVYGADKKKKRDKMYQALRTLNKSGIPATMLMRIFDLQTRQVGNYTYHGMELLGKPDWVLNIENKDLYNGENINNNVSKERSE